MSKGKRAKFPDGEQQVFLKESKKNLSFNSWKEFAEEVEVHRRTLVDWKKGEYTMSLKVLKKVCDMLGTEIPSEIEQKERYWYTSKGDSSKGGRAVYEKYGQVGGDPEYRKKKWREWWEREGKFKFPGRFDRKEIKKPSETAELAEFIGIILGDGGITTDQVSVSLNSKADKEYIKVVHHMFEKLFGLDPNIIPREGISCSRVLASSRNLVDFLLKKGLKKGNKVKQQVDIPEWIKRNKQLGIACVRGLVDTDGCVFTHEYQVNGKQYSYKKLTFRNYSRPLINSVQNIFKEVGLNPRMATKDDLRLDSKEDMEKYFKGIGSHNPKHLKRYEK